jgi:hypothetical protein
MGKLSRLMVRKKPCWAGKKDEKKKDAIKSSIACDTYIYTL